MHTFSFQKGYELVPIGKGAEVKAELMQALGITSHPSWLARLRGQIEPKVTEAKAIEQVFAKYGIKRDQIWG